MSWDPPAMSECSLVSSIVCIPSLVLSLPLSSSQTDQAAIPADPPDFYEDLPCLFVNCYLIKTHNPNDENQLRNSEPHHSSNKVATYCVGHPVLAELAEFLQGNPSPVRSARCVCWSPVTPNTLMVRSEEHVARRFP
jgi:hypothetical protein